MIAQIAKRGTSFKGAGLYYLHDKRSEFLQQQGIVVETSERVAWTQTRNLQTDNPDMALRVMAATAMDKDRLKANAGISNAGRKSKGEVYSYSLAWHPDEQGKFNKSEMLDAADQSLKALGAHNHQSVIVAHTDADHPHIHIIVNMVNPENGKNLNVSNDHNKLHKWSNDWRKERGEEHIYTPNKAKKYEAIEAKKNGQKVDYQKGGDNTPRHLHEKFKQANTGVTPKELKTAQAQQAKRDLDLSQYGREMHSRHGNQWAALSDNYALRKKTISKQYYSEKQDAIKAIKAQNKPAFATLAREQWRERKAFDNREKRIAGKLQNGLAAVRFAQQVRGETNESFLSQVFNFFSNAGKRAAWLNLKHENETRDLRSQERGQINDATKQLGETRDRRYKAARQDFSIERLGLIAKQNNEKEDLKHRWRHRNEQRKRTIEALKMKGHVKPADAELLKDEEKINAKREFKERAKTTERKRTRGRKRTRKRKTDE